LAAERMTKRGAIQILISHASRHCAGAGTGIRSVVAPAEKESVRRAIARLFPDAYDREMDTNDARNLGFWETPLVLPGDRRS
jgi:hypothetical protein